MTMQAVPQENMAREIASATGISLPDARLLVVVGYAAAVEVVGGDRNDSKGLLMAFGLKPKWRRGDLL